MKDEKFFKNSFDDYKLIAGTTTTTTPLNETFTYDDDGNITQHVIGSDTYGYAYDDNGNITQTTKNGAVRQSYVYDANNQLIRENNLDTNKTIIYTYDSGGNIANRKEYAYTTGTVGPATDTISYAYDSNWKDKLTSYDGQSITYDEIGNPEDYRDGMSFEWNGRQITKTNLDSDTTITYKYDSDGLRTQKIVNGVQYDYYYVAGQLRYEKKGSEYELVYRYNNDGTLASVTRNRFSDGQTDILYAVTNTRGDVIELRSGSGAVNTVYTYDSWGKLVSVTNASGTALASTNLGVQNSIRYRGYVYDTETGLYYLESRYYDPETGRFLNADDVDFIGASGTVLSYNAFAYCENQPLLNHDKEGNEPISIFAVSTAIVASYLILFAAFSIYNTVVNAFNRSVRFQNTWNVDIQKLLTSYVYSDTYIYKQISSIFFKYAKVALKATAASVATAIAVAKADAKIRVKVQKKSKTRYWSATLRSNYVDIGRSLSFSQAVNEVKEGRNVFTVTKSEAKKVAKSAFGGKKPIGPEIDEGKDNTLGYYYHFHTYNRNGAHIWYLF